MVVVIVREQEAENHDIIALIEGKTCLGASEYKRTDRAERKNICDDRKPVISPPFSGPRKEPQLRWQLVPLVAQSVDVPGQAEILERVPGIHSLKRDIEFVKYRGDEARDNGNADERRFRNVTLAGPEFTPGL